MAHNNQDIPTTPIKRNKNVLTRYLGKLSPFILILLLIEFLDELTGSAQQAAWPLIRDELNLTYIQIGLLVSIPMLVSSIVEPILGILSDVWKRRLLILGGGVLFTIAVLLTAVSRSFLPLLTAQMMFFPASGAFVSLSQAVLMDIEPDRHEQNMARWTFAGSLGAVIGPLALGGAMLLGVSWRGLFAIFGLLAMSLVAAAWRFPFPNNAIGHDSTFSFSTLREGFKGALDALKRREVLRWLVLLGFSDLMLDILLGFLALYFVDVVGVDEAQATLAVAVWSTVGLLGDFLLIPLLERVKGLSYLRLSAVAELALFVALLLVPSFWVKLVLLGLLGIFNAGWYAILQGQLYTSMPGQSGTVMAVNNIARLVYGQIPLLLGIVAHRFGLDVMMWLLLAGPIALMVGLPTEKNS
ncbi:MAG: MFS transporter [Anaerolineae bacterium]|nr:MFS transporter [Anaerolineae bacterium]